MPRSTWASVERGAEVGDLTLVAVAVGLGWNRGECFRIMADEIDRNTRDSPPH